MTGQDAVNTAREFNDRLDFDGVVLTKLDGDTRGGAAISIRAVVNKPLKFISSGEKDGRVAGVSSGTYGRPYSRHGRHRVAGRTGTGAVRRGGSPQAEEKKLVKDQFNFNDFLTQITQIKKMGNLKDLASMIPGVGKALKNVEINDDVFKQTEAIIHSMTPKEREIPR